VTESLRSRATFDSGSASQIALLSIAYDCKTISHCKMLENDEEREYFKSRRGLQQR